MFASGIRGKPAGPTPADPVNGAAVQPALGSSAATELVAGTVSQACGTDNAPIETPRPRPAENAAPLPPAPSPGSCP